MDEGLVGVRRRIVKREAASEMRTAGELRVPLRGLGEHRLGASQQRKAGRESLMKTYRKSGVNRTTHGCTESRLLS
jgi:hypothetical protein